MKKSKNTYYKAESEPVAIGSEITYLGYRAVIVGDNFNTIRGELEFHLDVFEESGRVRVNFVKATYINS